MPFILQKYQNLNYMSIQQLILICFISYTVVIFFISWLTSRKATNQTYYIGNRQSPWYVVAYGMIGASLSGVTFMSVPGMVKDESFSYMMLVFGFLLGYFVIATVLLPIYYKLKLTSIYQYLNKRFGFYTHKTGASFFLLSRSIGSAFRMYLVINVLQLFLFDSWGINFAITTLIFITLILLYTFRGGVKTIIWTDTLQTTFMIAALIITIFMVKDALNFDMKGLFSSVKNSEYSRMIFTNWQDNRCWWKHLIGGMFIAISMTGLDQEMMQKNISCPNLKDAQKNIFTFSIILVFVNLLFLVLGAVLYIYADSIGFDLSNLRTSDDLFPTMSFIHLGPVAATVFLMGLIAAAYSSADGTITALSTSFNFDILNMENKNVDKKKKKRIRHFSHFGFAIVLATIILLFHAINDQSVIKQLYTIASYTYGPILGLFAFGIFTKRMANDKLTPFIAIFSPSFCFLLSKYSKVLIGYQFGFELLFMNGLITFLLLYAFSKKLEKIDLVED